MCNLITKIDAAEYKGKLYRSAKEAATVALQDVGASIVQYGAANAGVKLLENGAALVALLTTINPALLPATPEKADLKNGQEGPAPEGPARKRERLQNAIKTAMFTNETNAVKVMDFVRKHGFTSHAHIFIDATDAQVDEMLTEFSSMPVQFGQGAAG